jgi:phage protein D
VSSPGWELRIDGSPAPAEVVGAVRVLEVEDHADLADMLRLQLAIAVQADGETWSGLDDSRFPRLTPLRVSATFEDGRTEPLIEAHVVDVRSRLSPAAGGSMMEVVAMDPSVLLTLEERVKAWPDLSDSQIASTIFSDAGLSPVVRDSTPVRREDDHTTMQRGTDLAFLRKLAQRNGYECYVELGSQRPEGHFHPPDLNRPEQGVLSVNLGPATNVDAFQARYDMLAATTAQVSGIDASSASEQPAQAQANQEPVLGDQPALGSDRPRKVLLSHTGMADASELQALAQGVVERSSWAVSAEGEVNGADYGAVLRAKRPVLVRGAGQAFSGRYYVEQVTHVFAVDGWVQRFRLRRNAAGVQRRDDFSGQAAAR